MTVEIIQAAYQRLDCNEAQSDEEVAVSFYNCSSPLEDLITIADARQSRLLHFIISIAPYLNNTNIAILAGTSSV